MTKCECPLAGYCDRHRMHKTGRLFDLCKTDEKYFAMWEKREAKRKSEGLGDTVERLLGRAGRAFKRAFRKTTGKDCGCNKRRDALNRAVPYNQNQLQD